MEALTTVLQELREGQWGVKDKSHAGNPGVSGLRRAKYLD